MPEIALLGGLGVVVIGLVALLLTQAFFPMFRPLIAGALAQVPVIGGWLDQNVELLLLRGYVASLEFAAQAAQPLADAIARVRWALVLLPEWTVQAIYSGWYATWRLAHQTLPLVESNLTAQALRFALDAESYAAWLAVNVWTAAQRLSAQVLQEAQAGDAQVLLEAQAELRLLQAYAEQLAARELEFTREAVLGAEREAQRLVGDAEGYARALRDQAVGHADAVGLAVAAAAAATTAAVAARVGEIEDSPCQRFCAPLGELGELLQGLEEGGLTLLLLGLLDEVRHDPGAVQGVLRQDLVPLAHDVLAGLGLGA